MTIEELIAYNKQLRNDLIMMTALAQNGQSAIEDNKVLKRKYEALLKDFKEFMLRPYDICEYCKHNHPCMSDKCDSYIKGVGVRDLKGYNFDWQWTCMDFDFGTCPKLENTQCNGCVKNNYSNFEYKG